MSAARLMALIAVASLVGHFVFGWGAYLREHGTIDVEAYLIEWARDVSENLQSEFIQLAVQFAILAGALKAAGIEARQDDVDRLTEAVDDLRVDVKAILIAQARGGRIREE